MQKVLLLKSENENSDNYVKLLCEKNFDPVFVPTLEFVFINLDRLGSELKNFENYSGLIFTSQRSVQAIKLASKDDGLPLAWSELNNYCVGEATFNSITTELGIESKGRETGNASSLADFIRDDLVAGSFSGKPFLFPCSNLKQDILQKKLEEYGFSLNPVTAYETVAHPDLEEHLKNKIDGDLEFLVFFSPSGVVFSNEIIKRLRLDVAMVKLVAIGPSTAKAIEKAGWSVHKTSAKPTPESLVQVLTTVTKS